MRVGLVCPYDLGAHGGVQDQVIRLRRWLHDAGHDVVLVGPGNTDVPGFVSAGPTTVVPANGAATPVALSSLAAARVRRALENVDVAHIHEPLMPRVSLAALRRAAVPMVGTFHADVSRPAEWMYKLATPLTRRWFSRLAVVTAVSPVAARVLEHPDRVRIIPNGIDVEAYASTKKDANSVVFLGRNDPRKGLPVLLEAWSQIKASHPEAELTVVGAEAEGAAARPGVRFVGRVSEEEKRDHLRRGSIFCAPNLGGETFDIVVVEAMAAGCAVVATGLPAFVGVAGEHARFVAPADATGIAAEIAALLRDPSAAEALGKQAAAAAAKRFGRDVVVGAYLDAYKEAVGD